MMNPVNRSVRIAGLAMVLMLGGSASALAAAPAPRPAGPTVELTEADVAKSNKKIDDAYGALANMWSSDFRSAGTRFIVPRLFSYRGNARTSCGIMSAGNAAYCSATNTIYYDEIFVALQGKLAGQQLRTDGDMAGIGIIAHEMGHAVAIQLGADSRIPYENEAMADCLAGAFARRAQEDGSLEDGDLDEAFFGMAAAGDPQVELTGNARIDRRRVYSARLMGHGTSQQRMSNFKAGLSTGAAGCLDPGHRS